MFDDYEAMKHLKIITDKNLFAKKSISLKCTENE